MKTKLKWLYGIILMLAVTVRVEAQTILGSPWTRTVNADTARQALKAAYTNGVTTESGLGFLREDGAYVLGTETMWGTNAPLGGMTNLFGWIIDVDGNLIVPDLGGGVSIGDVNNIVNAAATTNGVPAEVLHNGVLTRYPSLEVAVSNALAGDAIIASPQIHTVSNALMLPIGSTLDLTGAKINSYVAPLGTVGPTIIVRDNTRVIGGFVDLKLRDIPSSDTSLYQGIIGSHRNVNTGTATNVWVTHLSGIGETDCIFSRNTNKNDITFVSCNYTSKWDVLAFMEGPHQFRFYDCALVTIGTNNIVGSGGRGNCVAVENNATGSSVKFYGGLLLASNSVATVVNGGGVTSYEFHNVAISNVNNSLDLVLLTGDTALIDGSSVLSSRIDDDFGGVAVVWKPGKYVGEFFGDGNGLTNLSLAGGGTGTSLTDPNADRIMFWDDSAGKVDWLTAGSGLSISGTTITATGSGTPGGSDTQVQFNDGGSFGGDANFTFDKTTDILSVAGGVSVTGTGPGLFRLYDSDASALVGYQAPATINTSYTNRPPAAPITGLYYGVNSSDIMQYTNLAIGTGLSVADGALNATGGGDPLWFTNAVDGTVTNIGGSSVTMYNVSGLKIFDSVQDPKWYDGNGDVLMAANTGAGTVTFGPSGDVSINKVGDITAVSLTTIGDANVLANANVTGSLTLGVGVTPDSGGIKHSRITTGSITAGATALVTVTWGTAFADADYTVQASVVDSTSSSLSLSVVHVESISASAVTVRVLNNAVGSLTGELHVIAIHD